MGPYTEGIENIYVFLFVIFICETWKYVEKNQLDYYSCPKYCDVDHKHDMEVSGRFSNIRAVRDTCSSNDSLWIFHLETESMDSK